MTTANFNLAHSFLKLPDHVQSKIIKELKVLTFEVFATFNDRNKEVFKRVFAQGKLEQLINLVEKETKAKAQS